MSIEPIVILDRLTHVAPLGLRFFDRVSATYVRDLVVSARRTDGVGRTLSLTANTSGVYVLQGVPGLRDFENGAGDDEFWANLPELRAYTLTVSDRQDRFIPFTLPVDLPARGVLWPACGPLGSPLSPVEPGDADVPLFSAPARPLPEHMAAVRADLWDVSAPDGRAAAWAVLEVHYEGELLGRGISDARGCVLATFPYPPPIDYAPLSPEVTGAPFWEQRWTLDIRVYYAPPPAPTAVLPAAPNLCATLDLLAGPAAHAWADAALTTALEQDSLTLGHDLVLRTVDAGRRLPRLLITPAV